MPGPKVHSAALVVAWSKVLWLPCSPPSKAPRAIRERNMADPSSSNSANFGKAPGSSEKATHSVRLNVCLHGCLIV